MTPYETDEIIEKVLKKSRAEPKVVKLQLEIGESTTYGWRIMPDKNNFGPLSNGGHFCSRFQVRTWIHGPKPIFPGPKKLRKLGPIRTLRW